MEKELTLAPVSTPVTDEPTLTIAEVKRIAKLLNVLMEVDFYIKRNMQELTSD